MASFLPLLFAPVMVLANAPAASGSAVDSAAGEPVRRGLMLEHRAMLRCSAAFALVAAEQQRSPATHSYPSLVMRGREYFVRAVAQVMDDTGLPRSEVVAELEQEARDLTSGDQLDQIMPACLMALEASEGGKAP